MRSKKLIALVMATSISANLMPIKTVDAETRQVISDLIISEYLEGSSNNKAIELFNGTGESIDLSEYTIELYSNGNTTAGNKLTLSGALESGKTYVIANSSANQDIKDKAQILHNVTNFNGDDTLLLKKGDEVVDSFGQVGFRPDKAWISNGVSTADMTLVRKDTVVSGDTNATDEFDPSIEWIALEKDDTSNLGVHGVVIEDEVEGLVTIKAARAAEMGTEVIVKGVVTFKEASGSSFNYTIEDGSAGIALRGADGLSIGDEVIVKCKTSEYNGLLQLSGYELIENKGSKALPQAKLVTVADIVDNDGGENYESQRVKLTDLTLGTIAPTGTTVLTDESGKTIALYKCGELADLKAGDKIEITGVLSQFSKSGKDGYQLRINTSEDIKKIDTEEPGEPEAPKDEVGPTVVKVTPGNSSNLGENRRPEITATFEDESGVDMETVKMTLNDKDVTTALVKEENTIKYVVTDDLQDGQYVVRVEVKDTLGNATSKQWKFTVGTVETNLYFGQLHSHTNLSDGQGSIDEAYTYAKNESGVDFLAVTDHSNWFDNESSASMANGSMSEEWKLGLESADKYTEDNEFVGIYGFEMSWSGSTGGYGHINTFNTPGFETRTNKTMDLKTYYETLKNFPESLSQLNHPGKTFGNFSDYAHYDAEIDELVNLIEVGNGEGAIRSSGYFPSYEEYTRALDKGWHVAPTNNQDNHKGKWGNANTARTVVEATELTRDGIYEGLSERRVYATEDENLRISYKINGSTMGSILDATDSLEFNINVEDINEGDNIKSISIIGDGGKVVKSIDNVNSTTKEWNFTLDSNVSSYYYVRVDQVDKDIAVTAPIWVGERDNVGLSTIDTDTEIIVSGEEFNLETTVYNNEASELTNVKFEYYINGSDTPIVQTAEKVASGTTYVDKLSYTFDKAGDYEIIVKISGEVNGIVKEFSGSKEIEVSKPEQVSTVVIDGAHQNQYVTGDYADKITTLTATMAKNGIKAVINMEEITDETLKNASLLILSDPQSVAKADYGLVPHKYSESELEAIANFVKNGGDLIITSKADYGDATGEYGNAAQGNAVLEAIGAKLRFNDDQAIDNVENGGQSYRLYFDDYNTESKWLEGLDTTKQYSFYSGSTLIMPEDMSNVEVIVKGHENTESSDADNQGDSTHVNKGEVVGLAAETLPGGATVIASGATFFSNFEVDGLDYINFELTQKILNTLSPAPEIPVSDIADVRIDEDNNNSPDRFGEKVVVEGYVTAASNAAAPGNSFFDVIYVQDATGGLTVFGVSNTEIKLGQKVRITGKVSSYLGDAQIAVNNEDIDVEIIDEAINLVEATKLSTMESMLESNEGLLVKVSGEVTRIDGQNIYVNDGTGEARVYTEGYVGSSTNPGVADEWKSRVNVGDTVTAIGLASEDPEGHRLRVRDSAEIVVEAGDTEIPDGEVPDGDNGNSNDGEPEVEVKPENPNTESPEVENKEEADTDADTNNNSNNNENLPETGGTNSFVYLTMALALVCSGLISLLKKKENIK